MNGEKKKWWQPDPGYSKKEEVPHEVREWGEKQGYQVKEEKRKWWYPDPGYYGKKAKGALQTGVKVAKTIDKGYRSAKGKTNGKTEKESKKKPKVQQLISAQRSMGKRMGGYQKRVARNVETASPFARAILGYSPTQVKKPKGARTVVNVYIGGKKTGKHEGRKKKQRRKDPFGIGSLF